MSNTRLLYIALVSLVIVITYFYIRLNDVKLIKTKNRTVRLYICINRIPVCNEPCVLPGGVLSGSR